MTEADARTIDILTGLDELPEGIRVLIVGGGFAGLEIAAQLDRHGVDGVLIIEGGPADDLRHTNVTLDPETAAERWLDPRDDPYHRRPWTSAALPHFAGNAGIRARLGGRSLYWYGVTLPLEDWALDRAYWPRSVVRDLVEEWRTGPSLYERVAADLGVPWADGTTVGDGEPRSLGGYRLRPTPRATRAHADVRGRWSAYSPLDHWRSPDTGALVDGPAGVSVLTETQVLRVREDDGRVAGVVVADAAGGERRIDADVVVLCAGTVENSRLAIQARYAAAGVAPRLGGLADHIAQGFFVRIDAASAPRPLPVRPGSYYLPCPEARSNLFLSLWRVSREEIMLDVKINGEQPPDPDSVVECRPDTAFPWATSVRAHVSDEARDVIAAQRVVLDGVWAAVAEAFGLAGSLSFGAYEDPPLTNVAVLPGNRDRWPMNEPLTWASPLGAEDHEGGTLPLGGVLTDEHEFPEVRGLYAAGPATFSRIGAANPSLTTMALARRLAAILADRVHAVATPAEVAR
jgi:choline dehydrogenase-like flavoprotein